MIYKINNQDLKTVIGKWIGFVFVFALTIFLSFVAFKMVIKECDFSVIFDVGVIKFPIWKLYVAVFCGLLVLTLICIVILQIQNQKVFSFRNKLNNESNEELEKGRIGKVYKRYYETFSGGKTNANADLYFGSESLMRDLTVLPLTGFLRILPGTFIGLGILGTFIGFSTGVSEIDFNNVDDIVNNVSNLVQGLKGAFSTSIVGVLASIYLNFFVINPGIKGIDVVCKDLCDDLDKKYYDKENKMLSNQINKENKILSNEIKGHVSDILDAIQTMKINLGTSFGDELINRMKEILNAEIFGDLGNKMSESAKKFEEINDKLNNLPDKIKEAHNSLEGVTNSISESIQKTVESMSDEMKKTIEITTDSILNLNTQIETTAQYFNPINDSLEGVKTKFEEVDESLKKTTESMITGQNTFAEKFSTLEIISNSFSKIESTLESFDSIVEHYQSSTEEYRNILNEFKTLDTNISSIFKQINDASKEYGNVVGENLKKYLEDFSKTTNELINVAKEARNEK